MVKGDGDLFSLFRRKMKIQVGDFSISQIRGQEGFTTFHHFTRSRDPEAFGAAPSLSGR